MRITALISTFLLVTQILFGQTAEEKVISNTQLDELFEFGKVLDSSYRANLEKAYQLADKYGWQKRIENENEILELQGVDENEQPIYYRANNINAARTISTSRVHNNGGAGYNLEGQGMIVGEWDGGAVRTTHQELSGRAIQRDNQTTTNYHATHVGGTMIASGVRSNAKGMAPKATLWAHDWGNDSYEMSQEASNGLLISGHSYGQASGFSYGGGNWYWYGDESISTYEDYKFGFYTSKARDWDRIARLAPFYLICKSAGNDRNDYTSGSHYVLQGGNWVRKSTARKRDGDYGCTSVYSNAKNIITVGAVEDITTGYINASGVRMSGFSCWGPTDDGRIKPDVVANGVSVYSCTNSSNTAYLTISGTSMATPSVAGSLLLLQQHAKNLNNSFMRSATLKGLTIHTADEAGTSTGPDYSFGWGLVNIEKAAKLLEDSTVFMEENTLFNQQKYTKTLSTTGSKPVRITICWTDYEGNPPSPSLNPTTLMLRNDLDVRLKHSDGTTTYMPYVLNPLVPAAAATRGDNFRDNVEQIFINAPKPGSYTIEVSHKGSLVGNSQPYSIIIEGFEDAPVAQFTSSSNGICVGDTVFFTNTSTGTYSSVQWSFPGGHISSSQQANPYVIYDTAGAYSAKLTVSNGGLSNDISTTIYVRENPDAGIVNDTAFCLPIRARRYIYAKTPGGIWDGSPWMFRTDSVSFFPSSVGVGDHRLIYSVTNSFGCSSTDTTFIKIRNQPNVSLTLDPNFVCQNAAPFSLSGGSPSGGSYYTNGSSSGQFRPSAFTPGPVEVSYSYTDTNGCWAIATQYMTVDLCSGIDLNEEKKEFKIFPNPVTDNLNIEFNDGHQFELIEIFDSRGALAGEKAIDGSFRSVVLDVSGFSEGIYSIRLSGKGLSETRNLIIR